MPLDNKANVFDERHHDGGAYAPSNGRKRSSTAVSARTGQACDRCKKRKIRCDNSPGGCLPCRQNHTQCKTTDRNTMRATVRGHTETLERVNNNLTLRVHELEEQLKEAGITPKAAGMYEYQAAEEARIGMVESYVAERDGEFYERAQLNPARQSTKETNYFEEGRAPRKQHQYLGMSVDGNTPLSPVNGGTALSIFGMKIDLADCLPDEARDPAHARSYETMVLTLQDCSTERRKQLAIPLPPYATVKDLVGWYVGGIALWMPILHGPDLYELLDRAYGDAELSPAETVILHVVLAQVMSITASRNKAQNPEETNQAIQTSDKHYIYALSFLHDLQLSRTLKDMQAFCLLCTHVRGFLKPNVACALLSQALALAVEMGLHRSADTWPEGQKLDAKTTELRKRVFWTLVLAAVPIFGKSGRPFPISMHYIDIEVPSEVDENFQPAHPGTEPGTCTIYVAIALQKITRIFANTYAQAYPLNPDRDYEQKLAELESDAQDWINNDWPTIVKQPPEELKDVRAKIVAWWFKFYSSELRLLIHHPSRRPADGSESYTHNLEICIELAANILSCATNLWAYQSLDTTWTSNVTFIGAMFTMLFCYERRDRFTTPEELDKLTGLMDSCLDVLQGIGLLMDCGTKIREKVQSIVESALERIRKRHYQQTAYAAVTVGEKNRDEPKNLVQTMQSANLFDNQPKPPSMDPIASSQIYAQTSGEVRYQYDSFMPAGQFEHGEGGGQPLVYNPATTINTFGSRQGNPWIAGWDQWTQLAEKQSGGNAQEYMQSMEPANALMALGGHQTETATTSAAAPFVADGSLQAMLNHEPEWSGWDESRKKRRY